YSVASFRILPVLETNSTPVDWPARTIIANDWWKHQGSNVPLYRLNRLGLSTQILNIQRVDRLSDINTILLKNGWQHPAQRNWISILHRLSDVQSSEHLPLVSPLYLDKKPVLVLVKQQANGNKKLIVLRLWSSNSVIKSSKNTLWV